MGFLGYVDRCVVYIDDVYDFRIEDYRKLEIWVKRNVIIVFLNFFFESFGYFGGVLLVIRRREG